jgi:pimeloyl-ACP methyl ester carboxylesterase
MLSKNSPLFFVLHGLSSRSNHRRDLPPADDSAGQGCGGPYCRENIAFMQQEIKYCMTPDGVRLAYALMGQGSPPIVRTSHWFAHLEHDLESPVFRHFLLGLAHRHRLVRYDARGIGLSQRADVDISFEKFVQDLGVVVDAASLDKFILFGLSQGGAQAIAYAARHPERVSHLVLFGSYARGAYHRPEELDQEKQRIELHCALIRSGWGGQEESHRQFFTSQFIPEASRDLQHSLNELQRVAATAEMAERFLRVTAEVNVKDDLARIQCPTLVLHAVRDQRVPFAMGQEVAAGISNAKLVPLDTGNHLIMPGEPAHRVMLDAIADFLGDSRVRHLPGATRLSERLEHKAKALEQHWSIKFVLVFAAITGCLIFFWEAWKIVRGGH